MTRSARQRRIRDHPISPFPNNVHPHWFGTDSIGGRLDNAAGGHDEWSQSACKAEPVFCCYCGSALAEVPPTRCDRCGEHHWNNPKPCGSAIVEHDDQALLVRQAHEPWRDHWDIPGGFCDQAELPADAAVREVAEETGLTGIELIAYLGAWIDTYPDERASRGERPVESTINHCYVARCADPDDVRPDPGEVIEARYFGVDELPHELAFPDHIQPALSAWIRWTHEQRHRSH